MTRREQTAFHEAGHAVVAEILGCRVRRATIVPSGDNAGLVTRARHGAPLDSIQISWAGPLAQALGMGRPPRLLLSRRAIAKELKSSSSASAASDAAQAWACAGELCADDPERRAYLRWLWERTRVLLEAQWFEVEAVAAALLEHGTLTGAGVRRAIRRGRAAARRAKYSK